MALLDDVKVACRVTSAAFDNELSDLILAGLADIGVTDIKAELLVQSDVPDPLIKQAVITYVRMNFGFEADNYYKRLKGSYDEQKAQLSMSSQYTNWGADNVQ